jgi:hypothetical protein
MTMKGKHALVTGSSVMRAAYGGLSFSRCCSIRPFLRFIICE